MIQVFLIIQVVIAMALCIIVLMQRSDSDGFGLGSGSGANFMSGRQAANFFTRTTAILAGLFMLNSLWLSALAASHHDVSLVDRIKKAESAGPVAAGKEAAVPAGEEVPAAPVEDVTGEAPAAADDAADAVAEEAEKVAPPADGAAAPVAPDSAE
jgi:preprotein translocase subunit SecG